jgi:polysaccharide biosynthesis/export protein
VRFRRPLDRRFPAVRSRRQLPAGPPGGVSCAGRTIASGVLACLLLSCAPGRDLPPLPQEATSGYRLGPGDVVRLITFGEDQLTGEFRVADSGTVALPLIGPIRAAGLTPADLEKSVDDALVRAKVLRNPSVSAEITAYRPIFVLGEVNKPGQYPYQPGMTIVSAVAVAGGFTYRAIDRYASVVRTTDDQTLEARATRQSFVQPGDVVTIYERRF